MKLLHLDSSIQGDNSVSRALSSAIVARLTTLKPGIEVAYRDLATAPLPHLTLPGFATAEAEAVIEEFLAADIVVIGAPMYNFAIPTQLKGWLDHILVAGRTFSYGPEGAKGLAGGKRVIVAHSRGGLYSPGNPATGFEHAESYLRAVLSFIGITDPHFVTAEGVNLGPETREAAITAAKAAIAGIEPSLAHAA